MTVDAEMQKNIIKLIRVKKYTHDPQILDRLSQVAMDQEELEEMIAQELFPIYLCGETFSIPYHKQYLQYIPVNSPSITITPSTPYEDTITDQYQASPLQKSFSFELGEKKICMELHHNIMAGIGDFQYHRNRMTEQLYLTILHSDLPNLC